MAQTRTRPWVVRIPWRGVGAAVLVIVLALLALKGWLLYRQVHQLHADVQALSALAGRPLDAATLAEAGPLFAQARADAVALRGGAGPLLPVASLLGWLPRYGPTLAAAEPLLDLAVALTVAADESYTALAPLVLAGESSLLAGPRLAAGLAAEQPRLVRARVELARAGEISGQIAVETLPPALVEPLARIGAHLPDALDALDLAIALPDLAGVGGVRSYLVYAQNPDELRPTGGFISAIGTLSVEDGRIIALSLRDSGLVDEPGRVVYPEPPEPLYRYLGFELWLLRDSNWSPDFPTAARTGLALYRLIAGAELDGVIAVNPEALRLLIEVTGPLSIAGAPVTAANLVEYLREGGPAPAGAAGESWVMRRKAFLSDLAAGLKARLDEPAGLDPAALAAAVQRMLDERHLQVYLRQPSAARVLARRGWDGAVRTGDHDFLMLVDANLGYNKINPRIDTAITYSVDLAAPAAPGAELTVRYTHRLPPAELCDQSLGERSVLQITSYADWMTGCYWTYSRVLSPRGTRLISATAHPTPPAWMLTGAGDPGLALPAGDDGGASVTGAFLVVPQGGVLERRLHFQLPATVLHVEGDGWRYRLLVQKQAGSVAVPVTVEVRLPPGAVLRTSSPPPIRREGPLLEFVLALDRDQILEVSFAAPQDLAARP